MAEGRIKSYFLSDLHLGAPHMADSRERERRVVRFLDGIKDDATHVYLLGDVLDYWYEYRYVVPKGYVRFFGKLAELADKGVKVTWLIGNHDIWIFDYLPTELGVRVVDGELRETLGGRRFLLAHGDGSGYIPAPFRHLRRLFRSRVCQRLFSMVNPRWTVPFAYAWSAHSRAHGGEVTIEQQPLVHTLHDYCRGLEAEGRGADEYMFGHLHVATCRQVGERSRMWVTGDWLYHDTYVVFDGKEMKMMHYNECKDDTQLLYDVKTGLPANPEKQV